MEENKLLKFEQELKSVRDFIQNLPKEIEYLEKELIKCDNERQDLLHYVELGKFNAYEGYKIAKDLQLVSRKRRKIKDELDVMQTAWSKLNGKLGNLNILNEAIGDVRKTLKQKENRYYKPRIRIDLEKKINKC